MDESIPDWINKLALDIHKVIKESSAMPRFREMVNKWAENQESSHEKLKTWRKQRTQHFEEKVLGNSRFQDEKADPPKQGWLFDTYARTIEKQTESGTEFVPAVVGGWVPAELSHANKPKVSLPLPLSREHQLSLIEKYAVLAAVYEYGRKGTEKLPEWKWPENWETPGAHSSVMRNMSFHGLSQYVPMLKPSAEGWLRAMLDDVKNDLGKSVGELIAHRRKAMAKEKSSVHIGSVRGDVTISQDQSGGTTAHENRTADDKKAPKSRWSIVKVIGIVAGIVAILTYLGIKPMGENKMSNDKDKTSIGDVNGDAVVSQGQSGGITAHTVNVTVNKHRAISPEVKIEKEKQGDKFILRAILKQTTGVWDPSTKFELQAETSGPYETADIVKGLPDVKFEVKTRKNKENGIFAYSTRTAPLVDEAVILEIRSVSDIDLVRIIVNPLAEIRNSKQP